MQQTVDGDTATVSGHLDVTIVGVNDAPVAVADVNAGDAVVESGVNPGNTAAAGDASAMGNVLANDTDVDSGDTKSVSEVNGVAGNVGMAIQGTYGSLALAANGAWTYALNNSDGVTNALAQGETAQDAFTYTVVDSQGATSATTLTISLTGTNDVPVIQLSSEGSPPTIGTVQEDMPVINGQLNAHDPDHNAQLTWNVVGGTTSHAAEYEFAIDQLRITRFNDNVNPLFVDTFDSGLAPPDSPPFNPNTIQNPTSYGGLTGTFTETGGRAVLDSDVSGPGLGVGTPDAFIAHSALVRTNIDPANTVAGLKSHTPFTVEATFDLILPDDRREAYGIRLTDRLQGGSGTPPDQQGDDGLDLVVRMGVDGVVRVQLVEVDFLNDQYNVLGGTPFNAAGYEQIKLRLSHNDPTNNSGRITASFDLIDSDGILPTTTTTLNVVGRIFGTETPAFSGDDENWTRAQIVAYAPEESGSSLNGLYGTLAVRGDGSYYYNPANNQAAVQALAQGEEVYDEFQVQVTDEYGASDIETVRIVVQGRNDAPVVAATDVTGAAIEQVTPIGNLTDTGTIAFSDVDLLDTHFISPTIVTSAGALGSLTASVSTQASDVSGTGGIITWNYSVAAAAVEYLAKDQTKVETFTITLADGNGGLVDRTISVTITGTNDGPTTSVGFPDTGMVTEFPDGDPREGSLRTMFDAPVGFAGYQGGGFWVYDRDLIDTFTTSVVALGDDYLSTVEVSSFDDITPGVHFLNWTFGVSDAELDLLAANETRTETFRVSATDNQGATTFRDVTINLVGTNDAPMITQLGGASAATAFLVPENTAGSVVTITATDIDSANLAYSLGPNPDGSYDNNFFTIDPSTGALRFTASPDFEFVDPGNDDLYKVQATVSDGVGGIAIRDYFVRVTNVNEAPTVTLVSAPGLVIEAGVPGPGVPSTSAVVRKSDVDGGAILHFDSALMVAQGWTPINATELKKAGSYGSAQFVFNNSGSDLGTLTYILNNNISNPLVAGQQITETFEIFASDGFLVGSEDVLFTIQGTNDAPVITQLGGATAATAFLVPENTAGSFVTVTATDVDSANLNYSLGPNPNGSYDNNFFTIDPSTGALRFTTPPDFEFVDPGNDDLYKVQATVADGDGGSAVRDYFVRVTDVVEGMSIDNNVLLFTNTSYVDYSTSVGSEASNLQAFLNANGYNSSQTTAISASGLTAALSGKTVFMIPELERGNLASALDEPAESVIANWVADGHRLVFFGGSGSPAQFVNEIFGFSTDHAYNATFTSATKTPATAGTWLDDNLATLFGNDGTGSIAGLPAGSESYYQSSPGRSSLAAMPYGHGEVVFMGWDWFNGAPYGSQDNGWVNTLNEVLRQPYEFV